MGSELDNMAFRSILVAIAIIIAGVHAAPMPNDIVPETNFVEEAATSAHAAAKQIVTEMIQAGRDWTACEDLANTTREEVTDAVKTHQKMLDSADKGCSCAGLGQDEVNRTLNERNAAATAVTDAKKDLESATSAQVQLSSQEFQFLQAGECGWIMTDAAYLAAYAIYTKAVNTLTMARKTYSLSIDAHREAVTEAARLKLECECATQSAHATAWAEANEDNDANAAAWARAHHIDCVVQSISEANCVFGPAPGLTKPTLCDDIESVSCAAESGSAQHVPADEEPVYIEPCPLDMPYCPLDMPIATPTEGRTGSNGEQCFTYSCPPPPALTPPPTAPPTAPKGIPQQNGDIHCIDRRDGQRTTSICQGDPNYPTCRSCIPPKDKGCVFPFILEGVQHDTPVDSVVGVGEGACWCSTKPVINGTIPTFNRNTHNGIYRDGSVKYNKGYPVNHDVDTYAELDGSGFSHFGVSGCTPDVVLRQRRG